MRRVYVHVGLPKTGTSYLQSTLWASRDGLARTGTLVPGERLRTQRYAVWDLLGRRLRGVAQPEVPGSWQALLANTRSWPGEQAVLSEELLVHAGRGVARRIVRDFAPAEVHLVVTVRDLERVLGSMWQQELVKGHTWPWPEFLAAVRDPEQGSATAGVAFWLRYDLRRVLATWASVVPAERTHIVVVPRPGSAPSVLLERFAVAANLDVAALVPPGDEVNTSVGRPEAELLRRLNLSLDGRLNERQYRHIVNLLKPVLRSKARAAPIELPSNEHAWVAEASRNLVEFLKDGSYHIVGNIDDLLPRRDSPLGGATPSVTEHELADAAVAALTHISEQHARFWWKMRRRRRSSGAAPTTRLASAGRALTFTAKIRALEAADTNRLLARAARLYLRRRSVAGNTPR